MASNSFGNIFKITTWGESHGKAIGVVIDGCPANLSIDDQEINAALALRAPGRSAYTSPRKEPDCGEILSGVFEGKTTGAPISILIWNRDADSSKYEPIKDLLRPGHAHFTYLEKYGVFDYRGGGRSSGRETACRVAAGAVAKKLLQQCHIEVAAYIKQIGSVCAAVEQDFLGTIGTLRKTTYGSAIFCPDAAASEQMTALIEQTKAAGDSIGGVVEFIATGLPAGLGDPVYAKLEASLAQAMLSIPASKAFEMGMGFECTTMKGSEHNDSFGVRESDGGNSGFPTSNHAGGTLGGVSTGTPIVGRVGFKPTSSILKPQATTTVAGEPALFQLPEGSRHDPCVAIRAVPAVEAMCALVLADAILMNRCARL
jgi:chorismate synthase